MISRVFDTAFTISRREWTTETIDGKSVSSAEDAVVGTFLGHRQPAAADYVQSLGLQISKPHMIWCPLMTEIIEGDTLTSDGGTDKVRFVQSYGIGVNSHKEIIVESIGITDSMS
jgi:hypothetical protein